MANSDIKRYILVINDEIASNPMGLTINYKSIINFCTLSDAEVSDLSWAGYNEGFWLVISDPIPSITSNQRLSVSYTKDNLTKTFQESFSVLDVTETEIIKIENIKSQIKSIIAPYFNQTNFINLAHIHRSDIVTTDLLNFRYQLSLIPDLIDITKAVWPIIPTSDPTVELPPFPDMSTLMS